MTQTAVYKGLISFLYLRLYGGFDFFRSSFASLRIMCVHHQNIDRFIWSVLALRRSQTGLGSACHRRHLRGRARNRLPERDIVAATGQRGDVLLLDEYAPRPKRAHGEDTHRRMELAAQDAARAAEQREAPAANQPAGEKLRAALQRLGAPHPRLQFRIREQIQLQRPVPRRRLEHRVDRHPRLPPPHHIRIRRQLLPLLDAERRLVCRPKQRRGVRRCADGQHRQAERKTQHGTPAARSADIRTDSGDREALAPERGAP